MTFNNTDTIRTPSDADQAALELILTKVNKDLGKGTVYSLKDHPFVECEAFSTGSLGVDVATGVGGIPRGRIIEIYGPESSGKTTLTLQCIAEAQKRGAKCAFIDAEHALDVQYAHNLGVKTDDLIVCQPEWRTRTRSSRVFNP